MKKLISGLENLAKEHEMGYFHLSNLQIDKYCISINIRERQGLFDIKIGIIPSEEVLSDDIRGQILKGIEEIFVLTKNGGGNEIKIENLDKYFKGRLQREEKIIGEYVKNFNLTKEESLWLYKFFDPNPVVAGLTEEEVRFCLFIYPLREQQKKFYSFYPPMIHSSLRCNPNENVSRTEGLKNALYEIVMDLMKKKSVINP